MVAGDVATARERDNCWVVRRSRSDAFGRILTTAFASPARTGSGTTSTLYGPHGPVVYQLSSTSATVAEEFITDAVGSRR